MDSNIFIDTCSHQPSSRRHFEREVSFTRGKWDELMMPCVIVPASYHRSALFSRCHFGSVCSADGQEMPPFTDEASKYTSASSKSKPVSKRVLSLAAVRHEKSSPLISVQEQTQPDVKGQENPGQAPGDRLHFPSSTRNSQVTEPEASDVEGYWMQKREQQNPLSSSARNELHYPNAQTSETHCSQKKMRA